jgi:hypothetical protein
MTNVFRRLLLAAAAVLLFLAPSAFADATVSMSLTGAGSNGLDGVLIGPYTALINGVSTPVICDDYADESYIPESWTAFVSPLSNLADTNNPGQTALYEEVIYLSQELLAAPLNSLQAGEIQYALWDVFDSSALANLTAFNSADGAAALWYLTDAQNNYGTLSAAVLSEYTIYTPDIADPITCSGYAGSVCPQSPPQEFIVRTPEPGTLLLLSLGIGGLLFFGRRKRLSSMSLA